MDLKELDKQVLQLEEEINRKNLEKLSVGQEISILSFVGDELYPKLEGKGYGLWNPPGDINRAKANPYRNLASFLLSPIRPQPTLMMLDAFPDKATFQYVHGLSEELGITYGKFIELVSNGTIILTLSQLPSYFKPEFYEEIFHACEKQGYSPPMAGFNVSSFILRSRLYDLASKEGISFENGWEELIFRKHSELDFRENRDRIAKMISNETVEKLIRANILFDRKNTINNAATQLTDLNSFGFEKLATIAERIMRKDDLHGYGVLSGYYSYLIYPCNFGLLGLSSYDMEDVTIMKYLRVSDDRVTSLWEDNMDVLATSKVSLSLVTAPFEANIVSNPDPGKVDRFIEKPDPELSENIIRSKNAVNRYEFSEVKESYGKLSEIITERYNRELEDWFKREKIAKSTAYLGVGLTALAGATAGWDYLNWLLKEYPIIGLTAGLAIREIIEKIKKTDVTNFLVEKWPFTEKGLPFVLWKYGIKPEDIRSVET
ncbi:MAG: hypothetical protein ABSB40_07160 [Nitrososphaeria archaeon]|jgi:hypothetical protein